MVPARLVRLDVLPLNAAGKVDRHRLPDPGGEAVPRATGRPPRTATEAVVAEIAGDVLGHVVLADDDLFLLGAHSLHVLRIAARLTQRLGFGLELSMIFQERTVARIAASLARGDGDTAQTVALLDRAQPQRPSSAQERLWFLDQMVADRATYNVPHALLLRGEFDVEAWQEAVDRIVSAHDILRANIVAEDGRPALVVHPARRIKVAAEAVETADVGDRLDTLARDPFDLATDPLLRVHVLVIGRDEHVLLLNQHHVITDGWSLGVLMRLLATAYTDVLAGRVAPPHPAVQYADLAAWQHARLDGPRGDQLLDFWRRELEGSPRLELSPDRHRPAIMSYQGATHRFQIDAMRTMDLHALSRHCGATLFATLLAGFNVTLAHWTGQDDIIVGAPVANRQHAAEEAALGLFVNTIVLRNRIDQDRTPAETIAEVARRTVLALSHQDMPFERLVEALDVPRDPSRTPLFQIFFILQNAAGQRICDCLALPWRCCRSIPVPRNST